MHHHLEIVMPPTKNIEGAIRTILAPFDENAKASEEYSRSHAFWDWYVIGGRWSGHKLMAKYDAAKIEEFENWMQQEHITVSSLQAGKQTLQPETQIPKVDAKWNEMFPSEKPVACPLFSHSNDQYGRNGLADLLPDDVALLKDVPASLKCSHIIIAGPGYEDKLGTSFMLIDDAWNGVNFMKTAWDRTVTSAVDQYREQLKNYKDDYKAVRMPQADWLVVTVDYHS
jgi:hypothetical protein